MTRRVRIGHGGRRKGVEDVQIGYEDSEAPVKVTIIGEPKKKRSFDESCIALTGMDVAWFVRELQRNRNGEFDDIFEDAGKKRKRAGRRKERVPA